jgi:hypothetical protein
LNVLVMEFALRVALRKKVGDEVTLALRRRAFVLAISAFDSNQAASRAAVVDTEPLRCAAQAENSAPRSG